MKNQIDIHELVSASPVERNIPIPRKPGRRGNATKPFRTRDRLKSMNVGESFAIQIDDGYEAEVVRNRIRSYCSYLGKTSGFTYITRVTPNDKKHEIRVWRTE